MDCGIFNQVASGERITSRNFFMRMRPLVREAEDLLNYTKRTSTIYRGILNLLGYAAQGLPAWNSTQKTDVSMKLEDHHIYPRAYILGRPQLDIDQNEAEQLVDCVVNRTLISKIINIQIGKKAPADYLSELQKDENPAITSSLVSHLIPADIITDRTWNSHFKLFLDERAERLFEIIKHYTVDMTPEILNRYGSQTDAVEEPVTPAKPRLKDLIASGKVTAGEKVFTRQHPEKTATYACKT